MRLALRLGWAGLLLAAGALPLSAAWLGGGAAATVMAAALAPLILLPALTRVGIRAPLASVTLAGIAAAGAFAIAARDDGPPGQALRDSIPRLLTAARPAPATPELLLPGVLLAAFVGIWVAMRTLPAPGPGGKLMAAPAGGLVLYTAGALLSAGTADPRGLVAAAMMVITVVGWLALSGPRPPLPAATGRLAAAAVVALGAAVLAGAVSLPDRFEPRDLVDPPRSQRELPSPLPRIAGWHQLGDEPLLLVDTEPGVPLRLVTLSEFTGSAWSTTANYRRPDTVAGDPLPPGLDRATVTAQVTVAGLDGPWLPSPGHAAAAVSLPDVDVEPAAGSVLLRQGELQPGLSYTVEAARDAPRPQDVAAAGVPAGEAVAAYLALPDPPANFTLYARQVTYGASTRFEQAVAIEYAVREGRRHDPEAPSGSSYARLESFLFREAGSEPGARAGTSEQFATAFAVLARAVGLPTRVAVGFATEGPTVDGGRVVRGVDAVAWPEVYFDRYGWYPFDPTPQLGPGGGDDDDGVKLEALGRIGQQAAAAPPPASPLPPAPPAPTPPPVADEPVAPGIPVGRMGAGLAAGGTATVLATLLLIAAGRWRRRRRHRRAGDRGAWSEVLDLLSLMGRPPAPGRPAPLIAADLAALAPLPGTTPYTATGAPPAPYPAGDPPTVAPPIPYPAGDPASGAPPIPYPAGDPPTVAPPIPYPAGDPASGAPSIPYPAGDPPTVAPSAPYSSAGSAFYPATGTAPTPPFPSAVAHLEPTPARPTYRAAASHSAADPAPQSTLAPAPPHSTLAAAPPHSILAAAPPQSTLSAAPQSTLAEAPHPALVIAEAADRAAFAPAGPEPVEGSGRQRVWPALRELRRAVRAAVPLHRRLTWPVDPRPLFRRR